MNTIWVVFERLDENYSRPFKAFRNENDMKRWLSNNKDSYGTEFCYEEIEVE